MRHGRLPSLFGVEATLDPDCIKPDPISLSTKVVGCLELAGDRGMIFSGDMVGCVGRRHVEVLISSTNIRLVDALRLQPSFGVPLWQATITSNKPPT